MTIRILLDHDIEGYDVLLAAGLRETGWDQHADCEFVHLRDLGLPHDFSDQDIWRRSQAESLLLITHNRNRDDDTSLQATIERENAPQSWPVITIPRVEKLALADYRQQVANRLAEIILYLEDHLGLGRIFIP
jgi:predicted nuclease of predicted toxin-antitoxin system